MIMCTSSSHPVLARTLVVTWTSRGLTIKSRDASLSLSFRSSGSWWSRDLGDLVARSLGQTLSLGGADKLMGLKSSLSPLQLHPTCSNADLGSLADSNAKWDYISSSLKTHLKVMEYLTFPPKCPCLGRAPLTPSP